MQIDLLCLDSKFSASKLIPSRMASGTVLCLDSKFSASKLL